MYVTKTDSACADVALRQKKYELTKNMYVKLMMDFEEIAGFVPLEYFKHEKILFDKIPKSPYNILITIF